MRAAISNSRWLSLRSLVALLGLAFSALAQSSGAPVTAKFSGLVYDRATQTFNSVLTLTNTWASTILSPVIITISTGTSAVTVAGTTDGSTYIANLPGGSIGPGVSVQVVVAFADPTRVSFTPSITSITVTAPSQSVPTVMTGTPCAPPNPACVFNPLGPELTTTLVAYPGDILTGTVVEKSCTVPSDPRVSTSGGWACSGANLPIGTGTAYCPAFPAAIIPGTVCGHSGVTGAGFAVVEATATGIDPNDNNSFLTTEANMDVVLPGAANLECSTFSTTGQIPLIAWGTRSDLTTIEGTIPEDTSVGAGALTELTGACDPSKTIGRGVSMYAFGFALNLGEGGINSFVDNKYANLLSTVNTASISNAPPSYVQSTLASYITTSQYYFYSGYYSCAVNQLAQADSFLRSYANPDNFKSNLDPTAPGGGNPNPAGDIDGRLANLYLTINTEAAGNAPNPTWPVAPGSCGGGGK